VNAPDTIAARLIGSLFVDRGLVSESQIRVALEIQRETGEQLGQILVQRFGVSRKELARVVAEQWKDMGRGGGADGSPSESWRPLGEIFVTRGFISEEELDGALKRQRKTGERLGEALVGLGVISKFELAGALAEQMASLGEADEESTDGVHADVVRLPARSVRTNDLPYGALTQDPSVVEPDGAHDANVEDAVEASLGAPTFEPVADVEDAVEASLGAPAFEPVADVEDAVEASPEAPTFEPVADVKDVVEASLGAPTFEPVADVEATLEAHANVEATFESTDAHGVVEEEPAPEEPEAVHVGGSLAAAPEAFAPFELEPPSYLWPDPPQDGEPEAEPQGDSEEVPGVESDPAAVEPAHVGIDPEPHFELQADVPESIGTWHLLVAQPEPRPGLCVAFVPTRAGYRLVPLSVVPAVGEIIDVADVGQLLVLRLGASPLPDDTRVCAYVEDAVVPALATG
jgi:hypothetical protein